MMDWRVKMCNAAWRAKAYWPAPPPPSAAPLRRLAALALCVCGAAAQAAPSTFGSVVGNAVLCLDEIDNKYFYSYLSSAFGPAYKREGGAYWFKADATLWGASITDVIVSDDTSALTFLGVVADATPETVDAAIVAAAGPRYAKRDAGAYPVRESSPGSKIVYFRTKSKVFCAKYKPLPPGRK
ncbi:MULTISPECIES: hypothetical protein [unclassified Janthinobacterium]|uniref:hypothetical protein n=1 Tax=unclassified Janthinobacterium TaxID=2610881 RepID=UPI00034B88C9|nr:MULTISPECIES: hypothetical protein [unclassified Janthinobacterium]MEC5162968.1 hypothetical protein [Janthinobacterium sp. CG_S6]